LAGSEQRVDPPVVRTGGVCVCVGVWLGVCVCVGGEGVSLPQTAEENPSGVCSCLIGNLKGDEKRVGRPRRRTRSLRPIWLQIINTLHTYIYKYTHTHTHIRTCDVWIYE